MDRASALSYWDVGFAAVLAVLLAWLFAALRLGISKSLLIASARMVAQLLVIGYVLKFLFEDGRLWLVGLMVAVMLVVASREIVSRQKRRLKGGGSWRLGAASLFVSSLAVGIYGIAVVVRPEPWHSPQYIIPLLGMIMSNTMSAISVSMDRLLGSVFDNRFVIEQRLALGESGRESIRDYVRDCLRSGMTPVLNSMATAGIVALPGMMTGQILAGASPLEAVKYQIVIWFLIAAGTGAGTVIALRLLQRQLFDERDRLRLDRFQ